MGLRIDPGSDLDESYRHLDPRIAVKLRIDSGVQMDLATNPATGLIGSGLIASLACHSTNRNATKVYFFDLAVQREALGMRTSFFFFFHLHLPARAGVTWY